MKNIIIITVFLSIASCLSVIKSKHSLDHISLITMEYIPEEGKLSTIPKPVLYSFKKGKLVNKKILNNINHLSTPDPFEKFSINAPDNSVISYNNTPIVHDFTLIDEHASYHNLLAIMSIEACSHNIWNSKAFIKIYDSTGKLLKTINTLPFTEIIGWVGP